MHACVATLAALAGEMADICDTCIKDSKILHHDKIVNHQFAACSGSPPQCSTFSSTYSSGGTGMGVGFLDPIFLVDSLTPYGAEIEYFNTVIDSKTSTHS